MKTKIMILSILFLGLVGSIVCSGEELTKEFKTSDGFTIYLPERWTEIPKDILDAHSDAFAEAAPSLKLGRFNYGFQLSEANNWFEYPYILFRVEKKGRVNENQFKSLRRIQKSLGKGVERVEKALQNIALNPRLGETWHDPSSHILWAQMSSDVVGGSSFSGISAAFLTEEGMIIFYAYAKTEEFKSYLPQFEAIAKGIIIDEQLRYKPRFTDSIPVVGRFDWAKVLVKEGGLGWALVGFLGLFGFFMNKLKKK